MAITKGKAVKAIRWFLILSLIETGKLIKQTLVFVVWFALIFIFVGMCDSIKIGWTQGP